jgi:hypothetical protein
VSNTGHTAIEELRLFFAGYKHLHERRTLRDRPWLEDLLHWSADGRLHGHLTPPPGRSRSVTSDGWCPGP